MQEPFDSETKRRYASILLLKLLDLDPAEGGIEIPVAMPPQLYPIEELMHELAVAELVAIDAKKNRYKLTKQGLAHLTKLIEEAEDYIDELDRDDLDDPAAEARSRGYDAFRVRFLWGWYQGEFDDLVNFQERRGTSPIETDWAFYLMSDAFFATLQADVE